MIVDTEQTKKSGPGTAMFSRTGNETIINNILYQKKEQDIPKELGGKQVKKTYAQLEKEREKTSKRKFQPDVYHDPEYLSK